MFLSNLLSSFSSLTVSRDNVGKSTRKLSQNSYCPCRDSNRAFPNYKARVLPLDQPVLCKVIYITEVQKSYLYVMSCEAFWAAHKWRVEILNILEPRLAKTDRVIEFRTMDKVQKPNVNETEFSLSRRWSRISVSYVMSSRYFVRPTLLQVAFLDRVTKTM
jgi:hypothetical protein